MDEGGREVALIVLRFKRLACFDTRCETFGRQRALLTLDFDIYRQLMIEAACDLADRSEQQRLWTPKSDLNQAQEMSSPVEMAAAFLDDARAEDVLDQHARRLAPTQIETAKSLIQALRRVPDDLYDAPPNVVVDSDPWNTVRHYASEFTKAWRHS